LRLTMRAAAMLIVVVLCAIGCAPKASAPTTAPPSRPPQAVAPTPAKPTPPAATRPLAFGRVKTTQPLVALTFDCCQDAKPTGFDSRLVQILIKHKAPATFFLGGAWTESHPQAAKQLASIPYFELGNHSYLHPHMTKLSLARMREELVKTQQVVAARTGRTPRFFRPPYGEWNADVRGEAAQAGLAVVTWSLATGDPDKHVTAKDIVAAVRQAKPGAIIIMHANGRGWHTAEALPEVLAWLAQHKLRPVTLSELVAASQPQALAPPR